MFGSRLILISLIVLICTIGCKEERAVTFAVGGAPDEVKYWQELVKEFEAETGIGVSLLRQPTDTDQRRQGIIVPLQAKKADPDVFLMDVIWVQQIAASCWLESLGDRIEADAYDLEAFFGRVIESVDRWQNDIVALPVYVDGGLLYYRQDLLIKYGYRKPPARWGELVNMATVIQEGERRENPDFWGFVWQGAEYEGLVCNFLEFSSSAGGGLVDDRGRMKVNTEPNREALQFMCDVIHKERISPPNTYVELQEEETRLIFQHGNALFERNWPYAFAIHQSDTMLRAKFGIGPLPSFPDQPSAATLGGWHIGISRFSDAKEEAWHFVKFVTSFEQQKRFTLTLGWNPGRADVYEDPDIKEKLPHLIVLKSVFENAAARPGYSYYSQVSEVLQKYLNSALALRESPGEALRRAQDGIDEIVDRYER